MFAYSSSLFMSMSDLHWININIMNMKRHMLICLFIFMLLSMEKNWDNYFKNNEIFIVWYQLPTKLFKLFVPSHKYLRYLCYIQIFLGLWNMLGKFISIFLVKFSVKYFNACDDSFQLMGGWHLHEMIALSMHFCMHFKGK